MTEMETKILDALKAAKAKMEEYDNNRRAEYERKMEEAERQTDNYWKKDCIRSAEYSLSLQMHGYNFLASWKNIIARAMFGRSYHEWHPAQAGRKGNGHGSYATTELTEKEEETIDTIFDNLVRLGYMRLSKSGKKATFTK